MRAIVTPRHARRIRAAWPAPWRIPPAAAAAPSRRLTRGCSPPRATTASNRSAASAGGPGPTFSVVAAPPGPPAASAGLPLFSLSRDAEAARPGRPVGVYPRTDQCGGEATGQTVVVCCPVERWEGPRACVAARVPRLPRLSLFQWREKGAGPIRQSSGLHRPTPTPARRASRRRRARAPTHARAAPTESGDRVRGRRRGWPQCP